MSRRPARVLVVGAGIGGLTAACALLRHGLEVEVLERSTELGEVGAGLQIGPNGVRVLRALGLERGLAQAVCEPDATVSVDGERGEIRYREPLRGVSAQRFGAPYLTAHRADVHAALRAALPAGAVRLGAVCTGAESHRSGAVATLEDGAELEADVVVGADGIRSAVRESQFGADEPRFTGQICWRGIVPISCVPAAVRPDDLAGWIAPNGHVICYPIRGGELYNVFAGHVSGTWIEESWTVESSREELLAAYEGWHPALRAMLARIEHCFKWGIHDRDPLPRWTRGRVTLLGDAAHPMMPTLAQGASIAMEDGVALARHLAASPGDVPAALAAYDTERVPRASRVQLQARTQFQNNQRTPAPPPLDRSWIFAHDATRDPVAS
jgi:salicylate hydroxylase